VQGPQAAEQGRRAVAVPGVKELGGEGPAVGEQKVRSGRGSEWEWGCRGRARAARAPCREREREREREQEPVRGPEGQLGPEAWGEQVRVGRPVRALERGPGARGAPGPCRGRMGPGRQGRQGR